MPHKHNADRRHHIPKMSFKVRNWPAYEAGLRRRGSLTLWIEDAALECWQTSGPDGRARYADMAIQTSLMLRAAFKLALRQTEGLMTSVLTLMDLTISAPDHTTISRRAATLPVIQPASGSPAPLHVLIDSTGLQVYGAGQWHCQLYVDHNKSGQLSGSEDRLDTSRSTIATAAKTGYCFRVRGWY